MSINEKLSAIPVKVVRREPANFHLKRRIAQAMTLALAVLIPAIGMFRIDPIAGAIVVFNRQVWFSDFFVMFGFWIMLALGAVLLYSVVGTVFCGWSCPQNSISEWANHLTHKLLGKRANVSLVGDELQVAAAKNRPLNWMVLGGAFLGVSMLLAIIPMFYFYPPAVVWDFVVFRPDPSLARSLHYIYAVFVVIIFLDVAVIRHFWCRYACIYRVWQHTFKTKQTLHIVYDESRKSDCEKCNYCVTSCILDIDPRKTKTYDSCINCGECIDACDKLHSKAGQPGLLDFEFGARSADAGSAFRNNVATLRSRMTWVAPIFLVGLAMFSYGLLNYSPYNLSIYRSERSHGVTVNEYEIQLANKLYRPAEVSLSVSGLPKGHYRLETERVELDPALRRNVDLHVDPGLPKGLYRVVVEARSRDGWVGHFKFEHFSARN